MDNITTTRCWQHREGSGPLQPAPALVQKPKVIPQTGANDPENEEKSVRVQKWVDEVETAVPLTPEKWEQEMRKRQWELIGEW